MFKAFCWLVLILGVLYGGLTFYPGVLFSAKKTVKNITVHSSQPLKEDADPLIGLVAEKLAAGDFADPAQKFDVYLAGGSFEFALLAPFCSGGYARLHPLTGKAFIASADFDRKRAFSASDTEKGRALDAVMTRVLVRGQIKNRIKDLAYCFTDEWKLDGYAEHVALETDGWDPTEICGDKAEEDPMRRDLKYRLIVELVNTEDRLNYPVLMKANYSYAGVDKRVKQRYCGNR